MALSTLEQQALAELDLVRQKPFRLADHLSLVRGASVFTAILLWEFFGRDVNPLFLSYPSAIAAAAAQLLAAGQFTQQAFNSLQVYFVGLAGDRAGIRQKQ